MRFSALDHAMDPGGSAWALCFARPDVQRVGDAGHDDSRGILSATAGDEVRLWAAIFCQLRYGDHQPLVSAPHPRRTRAAIYRKPGAGALLGNAIPPTVFQIAGLQRRLPPGPGRQRRVLDPATSGLIRVDRLLDPGNDGFVECGV